MFKIKLIKLPKTEKKYRYLGLVFSNGLNTYMFYKYDEIKNMYCIRDYPVDPDPNLEGNWKDLDIENMIKNSHWTVIGYEKDNIIE